MAERKREEKEERREEREKESSGYSDMAGTLQTLSAAERKRERERKKDRAHKPHTVQYHHLATIPMLDILFPAFPIAGERKSYSLHIRYGGYIVWPYIGVHSAAHSDASL